MIFCPSCRDEIDPDDVLGVLSRDTLRMVPKLSQIECYVQRRTSQPQDMPDLTM